MYIQARNQGRKKGADSPPQKSPPQQCYLALLNQDFEQNDLNLGFIFQKNSTSEGVHPLRLAPNDTSKVQFAEKLPLPKIIPG